MSVNHKIIKAFQIIVVFAALMGVIELFYNAVTSFTYTTLGEKAFEAFQKPQAIMMLVASFIAALGVAGGICALFGKNGACKTFGLIACIVAVVGFVVFIIASNSVWLGWYKENYDELFNEGPPYDVDISQGMYYTSTLRAECFAIYSGVMISFVKGLVYFVVLPVLQIIENVVYKKRTEQTAAVPAEIKENSDKENI